MQAVILAAGKGTRLGQLTQQRSKAMLPVAGQPMLSRVLAQLRTAGLDQFIIVAHPDDLELQRFVGGQPGIELVFQAERKGAAHALGLAAPLIKADFLLSACDNLVSDLEAGAFVKEFLQTSPRPAGLLALMQVSPDLAPSMGMVDWDGRRISRIVEKPAPGTVTSKLASMPLYCFQQRFLNYLPGLQPSKRGEYELQDAMQRMIAEHGDLHGMMLSGRRTLTDARDLLELNLHYLGSQMTWLADEPPASLQLTPPYLVEPGVVIEAGCVIGPGVVIENPARIGRGAVLRHALVLRNSQVPPGAMIENQVFGFPG